MNLISQEIADAQAKQEQLSKTAAQKTEELQALAKKHRTLQDEIRSSETLRQKIAAELAANKPLTEDMGEARKQLSDLEAEKTTLERDLVRRKEKMQTEQEQLRGMASEVAERHSHKADLDLEIKQMEESLAVKSQQLSQLSTELASAEASRKTLTDEVEMLRDFMSRECALIEQKDSLSQELEALQAQKAVLRQEAILTEEAVAKQKSVEMKLAESCASRQAQVYPLAKLKLKIAKEHVLVHCYAVQKYVYIIQQYPVRFAKCDACIFLLFFASQTSKARGLTKLQMMSETRHLLLYTILRLSCRQKGKEKGCSRTSRKLMRILKGCRLPFKVLKTE